MKKWKYKKRNFLEKFTHCDLAVYLKLKTLLQTIPNIYDGAFLQK